MALTKDKVQYALNPLAEVATQWEQKVQNSITDHLQHNLKDKENSQFHLPDSFQCAEGLSSTLQIINFTFREFRDHMRGFWVKEAVTGTLIEVENLLL